MDYDIKTKKLKIIYDLQEKYDLLHDDFKIAFDNLNNFHVVTPVVGKFSTGKSSLLNTLLGKNRLNKFYLGVDLTPETSVPTEIIYGSHEKIFAVDNEGRENAISLEEYLNKKFTADKISKIQLILNNEFLKTISTIKIVDMPGFDSGIELHNRAIDDYLPDSHAYILTFAATEPVIPDSIASFLRELKLYQMPVYIVITKSKSVTTSQLEECIENIRRNSINYLGLKDVTIVCTNAKGREIEIEPFVKILREIENDSHRIFVEQVENIVQSEAKRLANYLQAVIRQTDLTPSELEITQQECQQNLNKLNEQLAKTKQEFAAQMDACINNIQSKVTESLYNSAASFEMALLNNSDINNQVNSIVRETIITAMQNEFAPKFKRYIEKMNNYINVDFDRNFDFKFDDRNIAAEMAIQTAVADTVKKVVPVILKAIGFTVSGPVAAFIGWVASFLFSSQVEENRRNEQRVQVRRKIYNEIIPQITAKIGEALRQNIYSQIDSVNADLEKEAQRQIQDQEKILADITANLETEMTAKADKLKAMNEDLNTVVEIMEG